MEEDRVEEEWMGEAGLVWGWKGVGVGSGAVAGSVGLLLVMSCQATSCNYCLRKRIDGFVIIGMVSITMAPKNQWSHGLLCFAILLGGTFHSHSIKQIRSQRFLNFHAQN